MTTVNVLGVEQKFDFQKKQIRSYIILDVAGTSVRAEVEDIGQLEAVMTQGLADAPVEEDSYAGPWAVTGDEWLAQAVEQTLSPDLPVPETPVQEVDQEHPAETVVSWQSLPDGVLPYKYKLALRHLSAPTQMLAGKLDSLLESIDSEFSEEDWAEVMAEGEASTSAPPAPPQHEVAAAPSPAPTPPAPQPPAGQLTWADGSPMMPNQQKYAKTVQSDDYGFPIVPTSGPAASQVVAHGAVADESGIGQV